MKLMELTWYVKIKEDLWNELLKGQNNDPKTITYTYYLEKHHWRQIKKSQNKKSEGGLPFFNKKDVTCYKCVNKGHISPIFLRTIKMKTVTTIQKNKTTEIENK